MNERRQSALEDIMRILPYCHSPEEYDRIIEYCNKEKELISEEVKRISEEFNKHTSH